LKIVVVGLGSIGQRHARILRDRLGYDIYALRSSQATAPNELGLPELHSWDEVKKLGATAAFICSPTFLHVRDALKAAECGLHVFIEKPLSDKMDGVVELETLCSQKKLSAYVGYGLRFHPVIMYLKDFLKDKKAASANVVCSSYLHRWRKEQAPNYSSFKDQGGGVILDLSHEFDYVDYLLGSVAEIKGVKGKRSMVTVDSEDFADAVVTLESGAVAKVHLDLFTENAVRTINVQYNGGFVVGDLIENTVTVGSNETVRLKGERDDYLTAQAKYFFDNLGNDNMMNNLSKAKVLLQKILEFRNA
jgi:predicted dehydrogenase